MGLGWVGMGEMRVRRGNICIERSTGCPFDRRSHALDHATLSSSPIFVPRRERHGKRDTEERHRKRERERSHLEPAGSSPRRPRDDRRGGVEPCSGAHDEAGVAPIEDQVAPGHQDLPRRGRHGTPHGSRGVRPENTTVISRIGVRGPS